MDKRSWTFAGILDLDDDGAGIVNRRESTMPTVT